MAVSETVRKEMQICGLITGIAILFIASPAQANWLDDCVARWQNHTVTVSGTVDDTSDFPAIAKNPRAIWVLFPGDKDAFLDRSCQVTGVVVQGIRPIACSEGKQFEASETIDGEALQPGLRLYANSVICR